jgi:hypothetical protein
MTCANIKFLDMTAQHVLVLVLVVVVVRDNDSTSSIN